MVRILVHQRLSIRYSLLTQIGQKKILMKFSMLCSRSFLKQVESYIIKM